MAVGAPAGGGGLAGLNSAIVEPDNRTIHGFYHSEAMCNYSAHFTNKSMSYALSTDGYSILTEILGDLAMFCHILGTFWHILATF